MNAMTPTEKRKFMRLDSLHLLDYLIVDTEGYEGEYSMGRTLDVSINGVTMETVKPIPIGVNLILTLGIEDDLVDISGRPTHTEPHDSRYITGIEFTKVSAENRAILNKYVDEFQARKETLLQQDDFPPSQE
jgi:hypothetical protein